jgi:hypothetical protein
MIVVMIMEIKYLWIGSKPEKDHFLIWGVIEMHKNGYDGLNGDNNYTYVSFDGRSDKRLRIKHFQDNERNMTDIINHKQLKKYTVISAGKFKELCPELESTLETTIWELSRLKK